VRVTLYMNENSLLRGLDFLAANKLGKRVDLDALGEGLAHLGRLGGGVGVAGHEKGRGGGGRGRGHAQGAGKSHCPKLKRAG